MPDPYIIPISLENQRAILQPLLPEHFNDLWEVASHPEIWEFTIQKIKTKQAFELYFHTALKDKENNQSCPFAVYDKPSHTFVGCTRFGNIVKEHKRAEIGWTWYHPAVQRTGINKACKHLLLQYGFDTIGLNRIELKTAAINYKSRGAILKIGATQEGVFRHHIINDDGSLRDSVFFSIIKTEWREIEKKQFPEFIHA